MTTQMRIVVWIRVVLVLIWLGACLALLPAAAVRPQDPDVHVGPRLVFFLAAVGGMLAIVLPSIVIIAAVLRRSRYSGHVALVLDTLALIGLLGALEFYPWLPLVFGAECLLLLTSPSRSPERSGRA